MSSAVLADLVEEAVAQGGIDSVTVVRDGYVVLDTVIYPFPEETPHAIYSCTKSVTGTLIGIAVDQGLLASVDVPVVELLPENDEFDTIHVDLAEQSMVIEGVVVGVIRDGIPLH